MSVSKRPPRPPRRRRPPPPPQKRRFGEDSASERMDAKRKAEASSSRQRCERARRKTAPERSVLTLIQMVRDRQIAAASLCPSDRRRCVEHLSQEGYSAVEIAEVLQVSERTITRDRVQIRRRNALERDPGLAKEAVGELCDFARHSMARLRRLARDRGTPPATKVDAERAAWRTMYELTQKLQSLGYLPTAAHELKASMTHRVETPPEFQELAEEAHQLAAIMREHGAADRRLIRNVRSIGDALAGSEKGTTHKKESP